MVNLAHDKECKYVEWWTLIIRQWGLDDASDDQTGKDILSGYCLVQATCILV